MKRVTWFWIILLAFLNLSCSNSFCSGIWSYNPDDWTPQELIAIQSIQTEWNLFIGRDIVQIVENNIENKDCCQILPLFIPERKKPKVGRIHNGDIMINTSLIRRITPKAEYQSYVFIIMLHEVGHGLGMEHVENSENIMFKAPISRTWGAQDFEECKRQGICLN